MPCLLFLPLLGSTLLSGCGGHKHTPLPVPPPPTLPREKEKPVAIPPSAETGEDEKIEPPKKNPAAVALAALGASKGGKARAKKLSFKKRKAIATKAAKARWKETTKK